MYIIRIISTRRYDIQINYIIHLNHIFTFFTLLLRLQQNFIQIVKPLTIRPREGNSTTGHMKLKKTVATIKVGKKLVRNCRERIENVSKMYKWNSKNVTKKCLIISTVYIFVLQDKNKRLCIDKNKAMFSYLKKTPWKIVRKPVEGIHRFKNLSKSIIDVTPKKGQSDKKSSPPIKLHGLRKIFKKAQKKESTKSTPQTDAKDSITNSKVFLNSKTNVNINNMVRLNLVVNPIN